MVESVKVMEALTKDFPMLKGEDVISLAIPYSKNGGRKFLFLMGMNLRECSLL